MAHWNNKNAILRDLSVAQGREVPVEIENTVAFDEKPPPLYYTEETEEEFYEGCDGSGDFNAGPDIELIQHMLRVVCGTDIEENKDESLDKDTIVEISKINTCVPREAGDGDKLELDDKNRKNSSELNNKQRKKRNVAVASLKEIYRDKNINENNETRHSERLLTPNDFIIIQNQVETEKVNKIPMIKSPTCMFKKKAPNPKKLSENTDQKKDISNIIENPMSSTVHDKPGYFVPSSDAGERYNAYLERSQLLEQTKEDIWTKAEKKMKEIDAKRQQEANKIRSLANSSDEFPDIGRHGMDLVRLPQHRHLLTGECTVCQVICIHSKEVQEEKKNYKKEQ